MVEDKLRVYNTINWLNTNLKVHIVWCLEKERSDIEVWSIHRILNKGHFFCKTYAENVHRKLVPDPFLNSLKTASGCKKPLKNEFIYRVN